MQPMTYEITIQGELPEWALAEVEGLRVVSGAHRSVLVGPFADQAALHGLLDRLSLLELRLVEVRVVPEEAPPGSARPASVVGTPEPR